VKRTDHGNRTEISDAETVNETATATVVAETVIPIANAAVMATAIKTGLQSATENDQGLSPRSIPVRRRRGPSSSPSCETWR
jgi:hypothetical protein